MISPGLGLVVDDSSSEASSRVDSGAGDGDGGQVNHKHSKSNGEWGQNLHISRNKHELHFSSFLI